MKLLAVLMLLALLISPSPAHDSWISRQNLRNPVTHAWCCGMGDCGIVMPAPNATAAGWAIHGEEVVDFDGRRIRVDEVVPYAETSPSADGYFYRCQDVGRDYDEDGNPYDYLGAASAAASSLRRNRCEQRD